MYASILLLVGTVAGGDLSAARFPPMSLGGLEVITELPGAWVRIDGDTFGRTPLRVAGLPAGPHVVEVGSPAQPEYKQNVNVAQGQVVRVSVPSTTEQKAPWLRVIPAADVLRPMLLQPWAYVAAISAGLAIIGSGVLWTSSPGTLPLMGSLPFAVQGWQWTALRWSSAVMALSLVGLTAVLFLAPGVPILRDLVLPAKETPKKAAT